MTAMGRKPSLSYRVYEQKKYNGLQLSLMSTNDP